ncbi:MAG: hypothetical protein GC184_00290 [Rhizobiales bacterium]|nr:hypothetical protein [Hyphomicrobiales bacterium]
MTNTTPLFTSTKDGWTVADEAQGPFGGVHGGAVSALLIGEVEMGAATRGLGEIVTSTIYLVRPAPRAGVTTRVESIREGGRIALIENSLIASDKIHTKASICFQKPLAIKGLPGVPSQAVHDPDALPVWGFMGQHHSPGFLDVVDARADPGDPAKTKWMRFTRPLHAAPTPVADVVAMSDFATLFSALDDGAPEGAAGWPNADLSVHLLRAPIGPWLGMAQERFWRDNGRGYTETALYDAHGRLGRACQSVVILPLPEGQTRNIKP